MVQQASRPVPGMEEVKAVCRHHWVIEASKGPVSVGVCQLCEERREFKNYIESAPWGEESSVPQSRDRYAVASRADDSEDAEEP